MAQVLGSPNLMACLTGAVGMQTLMELTDRAPTDEETTLLQSCIDEEEDRAVASSSDEPVLDSAEPDSQEEEEEAGSKLVVEEPDSDEPDESPAESFFARFMNTQMQSRVDAAFDATPCESSSENNYPSSYYQGPLFDSHLHIPALSDDFGPSDDDGGGGCGSGGVDAERGFAPKVRLIGHF